MNLQKAIEVLEEEVSYLKPGFEPDFINATKLGIEAIKRLQDSRKLGIKSAHVPLLGEIKE